MCEYCQKRVCPNGCPNNYTPRGAKRRSDGESRQIGFKILAIYGIDCKYPPKVMNVPLTKKELTMKS